jgi:hypothetical protein
MGYMWDLFYEHMFRQGYSSLQVYLGQKYLPGPLPLPLSLSLWTGKYWGGGGREGEGGGGGH